MKQLFILLLALGLSAQAQQKPFSLKGAIIGTPPFKYALVYDQQAKLLEKAEIVDGKFNLKGHYVSKQRFDAPAHGLLFLAKEGEPILSEYPSKLRDSYCKFIFGEPIEIIYQPEQKHFILKGGEKNEVQHQFNEVYWRYRQQSELIFAQLANSNMAIPALNQRREAVYDSLFRVATNEAITLVTQYPNSVIALDNFGPVIYSTYTSAKTVSDLFNRFSPELKESTYGKYVFKNVDDKVKTEAEMNSPAYAVGMTLPEFELPDQKGRLIKSIGVFKKYTLVDFWATWCGPCRKETPNLRSAFENYQAKGLGIITISVDEPEDHAKWLDVLKSDQMDAFTNLFNDFSKSRIVQQLKVISLPTNYLVDENGKIVATNLRGEELQQKLKTLLP